MKHDLEKLSLRLMEEKGLDVPVDNPNLVTICESLGLVPKPIERRTAPRFHCHTTKAGNEKFYLILPARLGRETWVAVGKREDTEISEEAKQDFQRKLAAAREDLDDAEAMIQDGVLPEWTDSE